MSRLLQSRCPQPVSLASRSMSRNGKKAAKASYKCAQFLSPRFHLSTNSHSITMKFFAPLVASVVAALVSSANADFSSPFSLFRGRATTDPTIISPVDGSVLLLGDLANVTWSTDGFDAPTCGAIVNTALYLASGGAIAEDGSPGSISKSLLQPFFRFLDLLS
ncbi:hypothetical protein SCHPADRAFT_67300 [Schizopora paradoxa]|uniref:Uncharacterized protein n=1 Tax=Schizopora paradoxa TaxID=27342 RepID=A0A0H2S5S3_9AGAM|nr:hypothetical protein SCHPADRAFT_67300 [Schizopora paradoxa]